MVHLYIDSLLAGLISANAVPHFVKGITGEKFRTPFGKSSTATLNVAWGWLNFVVAGILIYFAHPRAHELRAFGLFSLGVLAMGLLLSYSWTRDSKSK